MGINGAIYFVTPNIENAQPPRTKKGYLTAAF